MPPRGIGRCGGFDEMTDNQRSVDQDEFVRLFTDHSARLYGFIMTLLLNHDDTEEVFQNTSVVLWDKFAEFDPQTSFYAWSSRVAYLEVLGFRKRRRISILSDEAIRALVDETAVQGDHADERRQALSACLEKLSGKDREFIEQRYYFQRSPKQIALMQSQPVHTVYRTLGRIHDALLACIQRTMMQEDLS